MQVVSLLLFLVSDNSALSRAIPLHHVVTTIKNLPSIGSSSSTQISKFKICRFSPTSVFARIEPIKQWRSAKTIPSPTITMITQLSFDRLDLLANQCSEWTHPISAAVYVPFVSGQGVASFGNIFDVNTTTTSDQDQQQQPPKATKTEFQTLASVVDHFDAFHQKMEALNPSSSCQLDLELVIEEFSSFQDSRLGMYPFNSMRNRALKLTRARDDDLLLLLDVDFLPSESLAAACRNQTQYNELSNLVLSSPTALVLPAFEYIGSPPPNTKNNKNKNNKNKMGSDDDSAAQQQQLTTIEELRASALPLLKSKEAALNAYKNEKSLLAFHMAEYSKGHSRTNYTKWETAQDVYEVKYAEGYEPFTIMARKYVPWFDERFLGYGHDKIVFLSALSIQLNVRFIVHPSIFVIHLPHVKAPTIAITKSNPLYGRLKGLYKEARVLMRQGLYYPVTSFGWECPQPTMEYNNG